MTPLLLTIPLLAAAPIPKDFKKEVPALDGAWLCTGIDFNGQRLGHQNGIWRFNGDSLAIEIPNGGPRQSIAISTAPKASPKEFQFGNGNGRLGVYEIKGETLTICLGHQVGVRPADTSAGPNVIRYNFTRATDK